MKMKTKYKTLSPPNEAVSVYGYPGIVSEHGYIVVDVPEELAQLEIECGRLSAFDWEETSTHEDEHAEEDAPRRGRPPKA